MKHESLSHSLLQLSEALEKVAFLLASQKSSDREHSVRELALLVKKFKETAQNVSAETERPLPGDIRSKHQKGWLVNWLQQKGIYVGKHTDSLKVDNQLYQLADFLADHYRLLSPFYDQLKRHQNIKQDFKISTTAQSLKYIRQWCDMLYKAKIIDGFQLDTQQQVDVDLARLHEATYFINGYWLEILLRMEIGNYIKQNLANVHSFDLMAQVELVKPNRSNTEIDLLLMLNEQVYWFECKSGNIGEYYKRFAQTRKQLALSSNQSFLLVPMMQMHQAHHTKKTSGMTLIFADQLGTLLKQNIPI